MRAKLIVGNWKMNGSYELIDEIFRSFSFPFENKDLEVVICPPSILIGGMSNAFKGTGINIGAQNVHSETKGSFTGEISALLLNECGIDWCIVGHSERREQFFETNELIGRKIENLLSYNIRPILCVGETLEQRESGDFEKVIVEQLRVGLSRVNGSEINRCVIAYEPVWAIGTGKIAKPYQANQIHKIIRKELSSMTTKENAEKMHILYGGSVNSENFGDLYSMKEIDGALVGGASLNSGDFQKIVEFQ